MAEKHVAYNIGVGTPNSDMNYHRQILYHIFDFVKNSGQTAVRFADNNESTAVSTDGATYGSPTAYTDWGTDGFVVLESSTAMPSGNRWQIMFVMDTSTTPFLYYHFSPRGGWTPGSSPPDPTQAATWSSNPVNLTPLTCWYYASYIDEGAKCLISSSDMDTYGASSTPVEYLRINIWDSTDSSGNEFLNAIRVGGYIPTDPANDTNPACTLGGSPKRLGSGETATWGDYDATTRTYSMSVVPPDDTGSTTDLYTYGYGWASGVYSRNGSYVGQYNHYKTLRGQWVNMPVYLFSKDAGACVGYFGKYDMFGGYEGNVDGTQDSKQEYLVVNDIVMRWNTSA